MNYLTFAFQSVMIMLMLSVPLLTQASYSIDPVKTHFPIKEYEAEYEISWHGIQAGKSVHSLRLREDGLYHIETQSHPYLSFIPYSYIESSDFAWEDNEVVPRNYYYHIKEGTRLKKGNVFFDWERRRLTNHASNEPWEMDIQPAIQDKLTHTIQLRLDLQNGRSHLAYLVAEDDEVKTYAFTLLGREDINTQIGYLDTLKVEHLSRKGRRTLMWLARDYDFLPVKVYHFRNNKRVGTGEIHAYSTSPLTHYPATKPLK